MLKTALQEKDPVTREPTGKYSTARVLSWVFAVMAGVLIAAEVGVALAGEFFKDSCDGVLYGLKESAFYAIGLGIVSAAFYAGRADGWFDKVMQRIFGGS